MTKRLANPKRPRIDRTPEQKRAIVARVCEILATNPRARVVHVTAKCGVSDATFYDWIAADEELKLMYQCALGDAHDVDAEKLDRLIDSDAKSARVQLQLMQCRYPKEYAGPTKHVETEATIEHRQNPQLVERLERAVRLLKEGGDADGSGSTG